MSRLDLSVPVTKAPGTDAKTGRGKAGFFWAGSCLLLTIWAYFRLPETKERSGAELDRLFMDKVSARKFSTTHVDAISEVEGEESEHARDKSNIPMV